GWHLDETAAQLTLQVTTTRTRVRCPLCHTLTRRVHSRYPRTLADLPWGPYTVHLHLRVRKFFVTSPRAPARFSRNACPRWLRHAHAGPCGSRSACAPAAWLLAERRGHSSGTGWGCAPVPIPCCGWCRRPPHLTPPRRRYSGWMNGRGGGGSATARSWSIWRRIASWTSSPSVRP